MLRFGDFLLERIKTIGFKPENDHLRDKHKHDFHDILRGAYKGVEGGYGGRGHGTPEESDAIHADIKDAGVIKARFKDGKPTHVTLYKKPKNEKAHQDRRTGNNIGGRKLFALGAKKDADPEKGRANSRGLANNVKDDLKKKRSYGEFSGDAETYMGKHGAPKIPASRAKELTGKDDVEQTGEYKYTRKIGGHKHEKTLMGYASATEK